LQGKEKREEKKGLCYSGVAPFGVVVLGPPLQAWTHPKASAVSRIHGVGWNQGSSPHSMTYIREN